jgi:hypothetical protein
MLAITLKFRDPLGAPLGALSWFADTFETILSHQYGLRLGNVENYSVKSGRAESRRR